jgi:serine-type anaerobic sulfatase-maturating enzyme
MNFHVMIKPRGPICNLDCQYCYYLSKQEMYPGSDFKMSEDLLENFTKQYIEALKSSEIYFGWQGGEPTLMGIEFFRKAIQLQKQYRKPNTKIVNTIQTNGTTLNGEWAKFFHDNQFLVGISIDGPPFLHNKFRTFKNGKKSYAKVKKGLDLLKKHKVEYNVLACVHAGNENHPLEVYKFLKHDLETEFIQFIPIVEMEDKTGILENPKVTDRSVHGLNYGKFLWTIFNEWVRKDVGKVFVQIFDISLGLWLGQPSGLCIFSEICGNAMALEHNGDLFSCDHYVFPEFKLGNITTSTLEEMVNSDFQQKFGQNKSGNLPSQCKKCPVGYICKGACPKNRILKTSAGDPNLNYLCEGYKYFFTKVDPYMKKMGEFLMERKEAATIMKYLAKRKTLT